MDIFALTDDEQITRYYYAADGETACELHKEQFPTLIMAVSVNQQMGE